MQHLAFHSYKNHISTVQGVWMFCPKKGHILYCAVHYYFRLAGGETLEKKRIRGNFSVLKLNSPDIA